MNFSSFRAGQIVGPICALAILGSPTFTRAAPPQSVENTKPIAIVEIGNLNGGPTKQVGSGVAISDDGFILTARHIFKNYDSKMQSVYVRFGSRSGNLIKVSEPVRCPPTPVANGGADVCILRVLRSSLIQAGVDFTPAVRCRKLDRGEAIFGRGWPADQGTEIDYIDSTVSSDSSYGYVIPRSGLNGMSGGPVYDSTGAVVALIRGAIGKAENRGLIAPLFGATSLISDIGINCSTMAYSKSLPIYESFSTEPVEANCHASDGNSKPVWTCPSRIVSKTYYPDLNRYAIYKVGEPAIQYLTPQGESKTWITKTVTTEPLLLSPTQVAKLTPEAKDLYEKKLLFSAMTYSIKTDSPGPSHDAHAKLSYSGLLLRLFQ